MERYPITPKGYKNLLEELEHLKKVKRPEVINKIASAREHGDLSENAEYAAAREEQSHVEGRIIELEDKVSRAEVIDISSLDGNMVKFGAIVTLIDDDTEENVVYQIVGEYEADIKQGLISITSPLARALIGKKVGDYIEFNTPKGSKAYEIKMVKFR